MKRLVTREMQIKTPMRYHCTPPKMAKIKRWTIPNADKDAEQLTRKRMKHGAATLQYGLAVSDKVIHLSTI